MAAFAGWLRGLTHAQRVPAILILVALAVFGAVYGARVSVERAPTESGMALQLQATMPGFEAAQIETLVTRPLEEALAATPKTTDMVSRSRDGYATIELGFGSSADRASALAHLVRDLAAAAPRLPDWLAPPALERDDPLPQPAVIYAVSADVLSEELAVWVERALARPLQESTEVALATIDGADTRDVLIQPDMRRLATLGLSIEDVVLALRRGEQAPRKTGMRRSATVVMPATVEAIAARAVRLPDGDSIALAEVAAISVWSRPAQQRPRYHGKPVLLLRVYPRSSMHATAVADRTNSQLGWLRANGLMPEGVEINAVFDEARATSKWIKGTFGLAGIGFAGLLTIIFLLFGPRTGLNVLVGLAAWLPLSVALIRASGFSLNVTTITGLMFGVVPLMMMATRSFQPVLAALLTVAALALAAVTWLRFEALLPAAQVLVATTVAAVLVVWLLTPWSPAANANVAPLLLRLPRPWRAWFAPLVLGALALALAGAIVAGARAFAPGAVASAGAKLVVRIQREDAQPLNVIGASVLSQLRAAGGLEDFRYSAAPADKWRLQLDPQRLQLHNIGLAEAGRAFAVAGEGLVVGEIADADARLPLRLQLAPGAAGETFDRLLLRGERSHQSAVYLRDVGFAERVSEARERLRVQRVAAVEITARVNGDNEALRLNRLRDAIHVPPGYAVYWNVFATAPEASSAVP